MWRGRYFHGINVMILMPHIVDIIVNENAGYKRNDSEEVLMCICINARYCIKFCFQTFVL